MRKIVIKVPEKCEDCSFWTAVGHCKIFNKYLKYNSPRNVSPLPDCKKAEVK
uniref:Uncharacterized protein n=1 Tax=viral metagenome TaxID=1070528 RepID=A0A6M3J792_9ZZZZ